MIAGLRWQEWSIRISAAAVVAGGAGLCYARKLLATQNATALVFCVLLATFGALVFAVRGLGRRAGLAAGIVTGLTAAVGLVRATPHAPVGNLLVFTAIALVVVGFVGYFAGGWKVETRGGGNDRLSQGGRTSGLSGGIVRRTVVAASDLPTVLADQATDDVPDEPISPQMELALNGLGALGADFAAWIESETGQRCCTGPAGWSEFDKFVRATLRDRIGAAGVRVFWVSSDVERLEPFSSEGATPAPWLPVQTGLIAHVVRSGHVYVEGDPGQGEFVAELAEATSLPGGSVAAAIGAGGATTDAAGAREMPVWNWLLPLQADRRTSVLVGVRSIDNASFRNAAVARAVRNQLQLFWTHVTNLQALSKHMRLDNPSGLFNRTELLVQLEKAVRGATAAQEPIAVLVLVLEGLRRLDDVGRWADRDLAVQRLGDVLRQSVSEGDLLGRFSDDHFVVVMRRLGSAGAMPIAEKVIEAARSVVVDLLGAPMCSTWRAGRPDEGPRLRAGLAGRGVQRNGGTPQSSGTLGGGAGPGRNEPVVSFRDADGRALLERALGLLGYARQQRIEIATDLMKGLPENLSATVDVGDELAVSRGALP